MRWDKEQLCGTETYKDLEKMQVTDYCLDNYLKVIKKSQKTEERSNDMEGSKLTNSLATLFTLTTSCKWIYYLVAGGAQSSTPSLLLCIILCD